MEFSSPRKAAECLVRRLAKKNEGEQVSAAVIEAAKTLATRRIIYTTDEVEGHVLELLGAEQRWDCLSVGLYTMCEALAHMAPGPEVSQKLKDALYQVIAKHLEHSEPRVRGLIAKTLGALCTVPTLGVDVYLHFKDQLWSSINHHLGQREQETVVTKLGLVKEVAVDGVTGWRALETSLLALIAIAEGCGWELEGRKMIDDVWIDKTVTQASNHQNRYVREAGMNMVRVLAERCPSIGVNDLAPVVAEGLADPWPQVVYAASRATRSLLLVRKSKAGGSSPVEQATALFPLLLPRLCLSRYFVPEGVQVYSQDTWVALFGAAGGRQAVAEQAPEVVKYYTQALYDDKNHFIRIAACYAIKELAAKIETEAVLPYASQLVEAVMPCLQDAHWEVRAASFTAIAQLAESFPAQVDQRRKEILRQCLYGLEDESWSIREDAAITLGQMARHALPTKKEEVIDLLLQRLRGTMGKAKSQPSQTKEESMRLFNDPRTHTGRATFGCCGGLEASSKTGGKHVHRERYAAQPWEITDGAIYLFCELCTEDLRPEGYAKEFLPLLADLTHLQHFPEAEKLQQTVWNILYLAAKRLGTRTLKNHLDLFLPALLNVLSSPLVSQLTRYAAITCLEKLSQMIGPNIFLGRLPERDRGLYLKSCSSSNVSGRGGSAAAAFAVGGVSGGAGGGSSSSGLHSRPSIVSI